ncbi:MAG: hypothetical protein M3533_16400 [Actinomycetota bacterium]|jgi:hypothetical protein|nr:hypothetical protein [Actinomycetota bacterium]
MMTTVERAFFQELRPGKMSGWLWYVMAGVVVIVGCVVMVDGLFFSGFSVVGGPAWSPSCCRKAGSFPPAGYASDPC